MTYRLKHSQEQRGARSKDIEAAKQDIEIYSTLLSVMTTEVLFCNNSIYQIDIVRLVKFIYRSI